MNNITLVIDAGTDRYRICTNPSEPILDLTGLAFSPGRGLTENCLVLPALMTFLNSLFNIIVAENCLA
ncbi:hypothetical protein [Desulfosarcina sp.]|uniref:hypothetical protein n=1 Tax=Desulfosarcina sp. TaxID=2027861 RepID=UPI003566A4EB